MVAKLTAAVVVVVVGIVTMIGIEVVVAVVMMMIGIVEVLVVVPGAVVVVLVEVVVVTGTLVVVVVDDVALGPTGPSDPQAISRPRVAITRICRTALRIGTPRAILPKIGRACAGCVH